MGDKLTLPAALRKAAKKIEKERYEWTHIGFCNCGNLVQVITGIDGKSIFKYGIKKHGDWDMLTKLHRPNSGYEIDQILNEVIAFGLTMDNIINLENLSDEEILNEIGVDLRRDKKSDVILYLNTWADLLEKQNNSVLTH